MSIDLELRRELPEESIVFDNFAYDAAIIGVSTDCQVVYDYDKMIEDLMKHESFTYTEASDWIDYNTIRTLPYMGQHKPIIMYPIYKED